MVVYILLSAKRRAYFRKSIATEMGGVSRYFFKSIGIRGRFDSPDQTSNMEPPSTTCLVQWRQDCYILYSFVDKVLAWQCLQIRGIMNKEFLFVSESGPKETMTARRDKIALFSPPGNRAIFSTFWGHFLTKLHRKPGEKEKIHWRKSTKSSGEASPKLQISVPCRGLMRLSDCTQRSRFRIESFSAQFHSAEVPP